MSDIFFLTWVSLIRDRFHTLLFLTKDAATCLWVSSGKGQRHPRGREALGCGNWTTPVWSREQQLWRCPPAASGHTASRLHGEDRAITPRAAPKPGGLSSAPPGEPVQEAQWEPGEPSPLRQAGPRPDFHLAHLEEIKRQWLWDEALPASAGDFGRAHLGWLEGACGLPMLPFQEFTWKPPKFFPLFVTLETRVKIASRPQKGPQHSWLIGAPHKAHRWGCPSSASAGPRGVPSPRLSSRERKPRAAPPRWTAPRASGNSPKPPASQLLGRRAS